MTVGSSSAEGKISTFVGTLLLFAPFLYNRKRQYFNQALGVGVLKHNIIARPFPTLCNASFARVNDICGTSSSFLPRRSFHTESEWAACSPARFCAQHNGRARELHCGGWIRPSHRTFLLRQRRKATPSFPNQTLTRAMKFQ